MAALCMAKPYLDLTVTFVISCWRNINKLILLAGIVFRTNVRSLLWYRTCLLNLKGLVRKSSMLFDTNFKIQLPLELHEVTCT
jgi:hypothetical protein